MVEFTVTVKQSDGETVVAHRFEEYELPGAISALMFAIGSQRGATFTYEPSEV